MIIKSKPLHPFFFKCGAIVIELLLQSRFKKMVIKNIPVKPGHSYLLMCNHYSFMDGLWAYYLCNKIIWGQGKMNRLYIMSLKRQMQKNKWLRYVGSFSVDPGKSSITESFDYAAEILSKPGNLLLYYPQGKLESQHVRQIHIEDGIHEILSKTSGKCQLIWTSSIIEYFESTRPSMYLDMLDCGTAAEFDFETLKTGINTHHQNAIMRQIRYTKEP